MPPEEVIPVVPPTPEPDNSAMRQIREQNSKLETQAKEANAKLAEANAKLTEIERSKLELTERLTLEKDDLSKQVAELAPLRDETGKYKSRLDAVFLEKLGAVPESQREQVLKLVGEGTPDAKLDRLEGVIALFPAMVPAPIKAGSPANPGLPGAIPAAPGPPPAVTKPSEWSRIDLREALAAGAPTLNGVPANPLTGRPAMAGIPTE